MALGRRGLLALSSLLAAAGVAGCGNDASPPAKPAKIPPPEGPRPDPRQTFVLPYGDISFAAWGGLPPDSGQMAPLYGDLNKPGPYLVMMRWNPGWFSAPHSYATDRICVVVSGTWWVNSGDEFRPWNAVPVGAGGYVKRTARTPHYDGVPSGVQDPAVIAIFGEGPVDIELIDSTKPSWRRV